MASPQFSIRIPSELDERLNAYAKQSLKINRVDTVAEKMELTRAEVIERLIRSKYLSIETLKQIEGNE